MANSQVAAKLWNLSTNKYGWVQSGFLKHYADHASGGGFSVCARNRDCWAFMLCHHFAKVFGSGYTANTPDHRFANFGILRILSWRRNPPIRKGPG